MNDQNKTTGDTTPMELVTASAVEALETAAINQQVATAKKYPRSIRKFLESAKSMIALDLETAESCNYKLKRRGKDGDVFIEGPSVRLLEIAASAYGNIAYGSRIINIDSEHVTTQGVSHDMENNVRVSVEVKRNITGRSGMRYSSDMVAVTAMAAGAIARRNALNGVVPRSYINQLSDYAKQVAFGDIKSLPERRQRALDYFIKQLRIPIERVLAYLGKPSVDDVNLEDLDTLSGLKTSLRDGETTLEQEFPPEPKKPIATGPAEPTATTAPIASATVPIGEQATLLSPEAKPYDTIVALCKKDDVMQVQVLAFAKKKKLAAESTDELAQMADPKLAQIAHTWPSVVGMIKQQKVE